MLSLDKLFWNLHVWEKLMVRGVLMDRSPKAMRLESEHTV